MELNRMLKLILNENMKIYRQISTFIMLGSLVVIVLIAGFIMKSNLAPTNPDWKAELTQENANLQKQMAQHDNGPRQSKDEINKRILTNNYRLDHNYPPIEGRTLWGFVIPISGLIFLVAMFTIIISAGIVAGEYSAGTIKLLLIRPLKRWKILLSKYISVLMFAIVGLVTLFIASFLVGGIFYGFTGVNQPYLAFTNGAVNEVNMAWHLFTTYMYACIDLLMMVTFAFLISSVFRSSSLAIGISIVLLFTGHMLVALLSKYDWVKYILFANTDLTQYVDGIPVVKGMTMGFSLIVLAVYFIIFNAASWIVFSKRDVAA
jgi:ABC-2 type transport system permease protein